MHKTLEFLKRPPAEALNGFSVDASSMLTFIQVGKVGDQITSLMVGAFGGLMLTKLEHITSSSFLCVISSNRGFSND